MGGHRFVGATLLMLAALASVSAPAVAQSAAGPAERFEVASVKRNTAGEPGFGLDVQPGGRFIAVNLPLIQLIRAAYTLQVFQITDAPGWVTSDRFDINAKADRDIAVMTPWIPGGRFALVQLMVQSLLADRFGMGAHMDTREMPVYALVVNGAEPPAAGALRPAAAECMPGCGMHVGAGTLTARKVPMPQLAELLSQRTGRVVTDATGLSGSFDIDLRWNPDLQSAEPTDAPSIFTALQEQLGLKLESRRAPVPVLVIDAIQPPTPD
jgi:uncharacterized protein (TIGR03435 family)